MDEHLSTGVPWLDKALAIASVAVAICGLLSHVIPPETAVGKVISWIALNFGKKLAPPAEKPPGVKLTLLLLFALVLPAGAQEVPQPALGWCSPRGNFCAGPAASVSLVAYGFRTKQFSAGASPGLGYQFLTMADKPWAIGAELRGSIQVGPNSQAAAFSLPITFFRYIRIGPSVQLSPTGWEWGVVGGFGVDFGTLARQAAP